MTIRQKHMIFLHLFFLCARPFDQQLGSSMIYFFYLHTTIPQKYMIVFHLFFPCAQPFDYQLGSSLFFFICTRPFDQSKRSLLLFNLFVSQLCQYFACYIQGHTSLIFRSLYFWQYCLYILLAISIAVPPLYFVHYIHGEVLLLYFVRYIHGYMKSWPNNWQEKLPVNCHRSVWLALRIYLAKFC